MTPSYGVRERTAPAYGARWSRERVETAALRVLRWLTVAFFLVVTLVPFYYMVLLSFRSIQALLLAPGRLWPSLGELTASTYVDVLRSMDEGGQGFLLFMRNSAVLAVLTVIATLLVSIPGAYAVSRLRFSGRRQVHFLFLAVYLFPSIVLAIPLFVLLSLLGLRGSIYPLVVVYISQTVPVSIYMLRNYFETVPRSVEEAAAVDGASRLGVVWRVSIPLAMPAITATALYVFMIAWNEFLFALLFLTEDPANWTVSLGLARLSGSIEIPATVLMAGSVILTLPIVVLFFLAERMLTEGLTSGAEKG
ncbi:carbohydrate ABC transporter permease [Bailinhaonella thermotolerans]|uniref:Carbohydrate ABC transporter permease n=1 Tax=Bailinhaonella thermotolerans TaxID=1070861 RepID=A0A3A4A2D4_9ACTN|nr:carbohydrate ABC transporter permease [Bailinhaonella thermotolerans]RJL21708.1 carbohydrate ABC transporter permease [Bailinhaonella thermotolerans]